jgi:nicotinamidase-related amidase
MGITGLAVAGVATNACVAATAFDAADRGYRTVLVEDACAAIDPVLHEATLLIFSHLYGRVLTADALLRELEGREGA